MVRRRAVPKPAFAAEGALGPALFALAATWSRHPPPQVQLRRGLKPSISRKLDDISLSPTGPNGSHLGCLTRPFASGCGWSRSTRITPNPHNPRTHPPKQIRQIADSIHAFGFTSPLLVDEDLNLIAGHGRFAAALTLGMSEIPVLVLSGLSAAKRRALAIADNRIAEEAGWDRRRLAIEIPELTELLSLEQLDISIPGFQPIEIEYIRRDR